MKYSPIIRRLSAYLIDCLLAFLVLVTALQLSVFVPIRQLFFGSDDWFNSGWLTEVYTLLTISLPIWLYFTLLEISPWQATIGKRLLGLQTLDASTKSRISFPQALLRTFVKLLPWEIAHFTNNIPMPMWYDPAPGFRLGFAVVPLLVTVYVVLMLFMPNKQSLDDLVARTVVVRVV